MQQRPNCKNGWVENNGIIICRSHFFFRRNGACFCFLCVADAYVKAYDGCCGYDEADTERYLEEIFADVYADMQRGGAGREGPDAGPGYGPALRRGH